MNKFKKPILFPFETRKPSEDCPPAEPRKKKWCLSCILWKALVRTCTFLGAIMLISAVVGALFSAREAAPSLPDDMILYLPLEEEFAEHPNDVMAALSAFGDRPLTIREAVRALEQAGQDPRVKGIVAEFKGGHYSLAHIQELRAALDRFKASGDKFSYIYGEAFSGVGGGLGSYYLASAFDQIWMQPMGTLSIAGIGMEMPFARELMDKIGVTPEFFARKEYKNLFESFTNSEMSSATREAMTALVDDLAGQLSDGIAQSREMENAALRQQIDRGLLTDEEALAAGLVDRLDYADALTREMRQAVSGDPEDQSVPFVALEDYAHARDDEARLARLARHDQKDHQKIAVVYIVGAIMSTAEGAAYGENVAAADEISELIDKAAGDKGVRTIVVRIDSPGGAPAASETIRHALMQAKAKEKTIIVSMGATAASGGYWIASAADYIFADPGTLTGSIGVAGGKFALTGLWDKIGVNWDGVQWGKNAGLWSPNKTLSASERERFNAMMDRTYDGFIARVAEGRGMTLEAADAVARGRVWTGAQALNNGLVDALGGLSATLDYVAAQAGLPDATHLDLVILPRTLTPVEQIMDLLEGQVMMGDALKTALGRFEAFMNAPLDSRLPILRIE